MCDPRLRFGLVLPNAPVSIPFVSPIAFVFVAAAADLLIVIDSIAWVPQGQPALHARGEHAQLVACAWQGARRIEAHAVDVFGFEVPVS